MAKAKAKSTAKAAERHDSNPKTKPGVTGFQQEYNQEPGPTQDLNPDAVTEDSVLPPPREIENVQPARRSARRSTAVAPMGMPTAGATRAARKSAKRR